MQPTRATRVPPEPPFAPTTYLALGVADLRAAEVALENWRRGADLAGLREQAELAKLPAVEREACVKFWLEVAGQLEEGQTRGRGALIFPRRRKKRVRVAACPELY